MKILPKTQLEMIYQYAKKFKIGAAKKAKFMKTEWNFDIKL